MAKGDKYKVELWYRGVTRIGEIRRMTNNLRWSKKRNGVYAIEFSMETKRFHDWCSSIGEDPSNVLDLLNVDVRIKVRDTYVIGATIIEAPGNMNQSNATIQVSCDGFLRLLGRKNITKTYTNQWTGGIIQDALNVKQAETNGSLGIVFNPSSYMGNSNTRQDTYFDQNLQERIVNRSKYVSDPFDFEFAPDRKLTLYEKIGANRPGVEIVYPNTGRGIGALSMTAKYTGDTVANRIIAYGAGFGSEALRYVADDVTAQLRDGVIEDKVTFNDVTEITTLEQYAKAELLLRKDKLKQPGPVVSGDFLKTDELTVGDRVTGVHDKFSLYAMNDLYRIEEFSVDVDENDHEEITLTLDDFFA